MLVELQIESVQLPGRSGAWDVTIANGHIVDLAPTNLASTNLADTLPLSAAPQVIDGTDRLLIPGLVDAHIHLDKALLLNYSPAQQGDFAEAMRETLRLKQSFTVADVQTRARRVIEAAIGHGVTAMRSHVEVDSTVGLTGMEALLPLQQAYAWGITLQLAVFAQEGITNQPGTETLLRQAMQMGGNAIGSAPYVDPNPERNVQIIFDIAEAFNCDVDFHLDFLDDHQPLLLPFVAAETVKRGWQGRVCLGHMTKLAGLPPEDLETIASTIREAGLSVLALPASDLYMMARQDTHNVRRGVAPVHTLAKWGVNVGLATNNVLNLFTPFGDGDVLKICTLLAQVLQLGTPESHELCLNMATTQAAQAIGIHTYGLQVGKVADLVLLKANSVTEAIGAAPVERIGIKQGKIVSQCQVTRTLLSNEIRGTGAGN